MSQIISGENAVGDKTPGISGRARHAGFAFEPLTVAIQLGQYLQGAMVTGSSHTRIHCPIHLTLSLTHTRKPTLQSRKSHSCSKGVGKTKGHRSSVRTACGELLVFRFFRHFFTHSEKTWRAGPYCLYSWLHGKDWLI